MKRLLNRFAPTGSAVLLAALTAALLIAAAGCDITTLNDNPNQPPESETPKLLSNAQNQIANTYWQDYPSGFWIRYAQYWTTNQYTDGDRYRYASSRPASLNGLWEDYYLALNDLQEIIRKNQNPTQETLAFGAASNQIAIAKIMQAWTLQVMTDMWGPIPLDEALQGRESLEDEEGVFTPSYTQQEQVYTAIIDSLSSASDMIDASGTALASGDLIYGGDMSKWKKFANSLKMRAAMRISDRKPDVAATAVEEAVEAGPFESNDDNPLLEFTTPPYQNPFYENYEVEGRDDWAATESIVSIMNENEDPRRPAYFADANSDTPDEEFNGLPYGLPGGQAQRLFTDPGTNFSGPSQDVRTASSPTIFMLYDEVLFIKAEAALRSDMDVSNIDDDGEDLYRDAIRASMDYWGVPDEGAVDDYLDEVETPTEDNYEQVLGVQKWIAQYLQGVQGWSTWRRMDFEGVFQIPPGNDAVARFGCPIAIRMVYPNDESTLNQSNLNDAINDFLSGDGAASDDQGVKLWWDTEAPICQN
ncbi:MAG: hypothetical protein BRD40_04250 [Bacteroidetes bacterium QS_1_65_9]|nr:MAG: hypothetical protein BRD40_04250 [Bacteroidetes bacterium QS_1_65_9]